MKINVIIATSALTLTLLTSAFAETFNVLGTSNPWLAGMPDNSTQPGDGLPFLFINFAPGDMLKFTASGSAGYQPGSESGPEGIAGYPVTHGSLNGIGSIMNSKANALIAVFLNGAQPDLRDFVAFPIPPALDFTSP
ncbi:MAG: hypothetical protein M3Y82_05360, partial [Verrucomicrobiota bacterium]|nr:hypothetical protein [Verrucomicrobiota bacterium]